MATTDKQKLLFLVSKFAPANTGAELYNVRLLNKLQSLGYNVEPHTEAELPLLFKRAPFAWIPYFLLCLKQPPDTIILSSHGLQTRQFLPFLLIKLLTGKKILVFAHAIRDYRKGPIWRAVNFAINYVYFKTADHIIANSIYTKNQLKCFNVKDDKITVIYPGIKLDSKPGIKTYEDTPVNILSVGLLTEVKGHHLVLETLRDIEGDYKLKIAGGKDIFRDYSSKLDRMINEYSLKDRVELLGHVDRNSILGLLDEAQVFVLNSKYEGFGIANLEAASFGLSILTTTSGAIPEFFTDGQNALLVRYGDIPSLRGALQKLINDADLRKNLGREATEMPILKRTWDECTDEVISVIENI